MRITFLGTGTSTGVPEIGCTCPVCTSSDERDKRLRCSALIETQSGKHILIDCGPDFRAQMLKVPFRPIDAVLLTHEHYDHVGGLDDLRPFCRESDVPIYALPDVIKAIKNRIPYCFAEKRYPGVPALTLHEVQPLRPFSAAGVLVTPLPVLHGKLPILGYKIGRLAYITDMLTMPEETFKELSDISLLVMNALRITPHATHQNLERALEMQQLIARNSTVQETFLIHMSHGIGLHKHISSSLPDHVHFAYDGLEVSF